MNINCLFRNFICLLCSFLFGICYNVCAFFISAYKMIDKDALIIYVVLGLLISLWCFVQYLSFNVHIYNLSALGGLLASVSVFRNNWKILEFFGGSDYNICFDNFQNINPAYYIFDDYFYFLSIIILSSITVTLLKKRRPEINLEKNKLKLTFRNCDSKKCVNLPISLQSKYYFYCESYVKSGSIYIEVVNVDNKIVCSNTLSENDYFEFELTNGDYIINVIGNE